MAFSAGTFAPAPERASVASMVKAQALIETKLFLRHGEQQLLSIVIPAALLIGLTLVPVLDVADPVSQVFPFTLAIAGMSSGFTGQAIAVAFDRRYGALKRIGASGVPTWTIIAGKIAAVLGVALLQAAILTIIALVLGWAPAVSAVVLALCVFVIGVATFTALGLLLGGTLSSELVLAIANLVWFVLIGAAAYTQFRMSGQPSFGLSLVPSVALTSAIDSALAGGFPWQKLLILLAWAGGSTAAATKLFRFTA